LTGSAPPSSGPTVGGGEFRGLIVPLLILTGLFFVNFTSRLVMAPLLPNIEADLGLSHAQAGSLFILISLGYITTLLLSGLLAARLTNRKALLLTTFALVLIMIAIPLARDLATLALALFGVGAACGIYLPTAMAIIYHLVRPQDWGKAVALHELAPNLSFCLTPVISAFLLRWTPWRGVVALTGGLTLLAGLVYLLAGHKDDFRSQSFSPSAARLFLNQPSFWIMALVFCLSIGSSMGIFNMLPLFLVAEKGLDQEWANTLISLSRILTIVTAFGSGWVTDRLGASRALKIYLLISGGSSLFLGLSPDRLITPAVFIQPLLTVCLFPASFAVLASVGPPETRNLALSFVIPPAFLIGSGPISAGIGYLGELGHFGAGIALVGALTMASTLLLPLLDRARN